MLLERRAYLVDLGIGIECHSFLRIMHIVAESIIENTKVRSHKRGAQDHYLPADIPLSFNNLILTIVNG